MGSPRKSTRLQRKPTKFNDLPRYICIEAYNTTVYIQNRVRHKVLGKMTPEEAFIGKKPDVGHFKIFRSLEYFHILGDTHTKLQ